MRNMLMIKHFVEYLSSNRTTN